MAGGKFRQVVFDNAKLVCLPGVGEGLCVLFGVAEHFAQLGVVIGAVHGGVDVVSEGWFVTCSGVSLDSQREIRRYYEDRQEKRRWKSLQEIY